MSWNFSRALEAEFSPEGFSDTERCARSKAIPIASDDSCSDKMKGIFHRSPFGTMFVPSTDAHGEALLTAFLAGFRVKPIPARLEEGTLRMISGRKCSGWWQMSLPGSYAPRTPRDARSIERPTTLNRWVTRLGAWRFPRETWVLTTFGSGIGYLHTPTTTANYACASMQKWPNCREYVRVFGMPTPTNHEWLMGFPIGWTDSKPLETHKFLLWLQQHSPFSHDKTETQDDHHRQ